MTDEFGVPDNTFGPVPEKFYGLLGRIVALGALVEMRFGTVIERITERSEDSLAGWQMGRLGAEFDKVEKQRSGEGRPLSAGMVALRSQARDAMERRNALVHSLWPNPTLEEARGWRSVPQGKRSSDDGTIQWTYTSETDMRALISRLVQIGKALRDIS